MFAIRNGVISSLSTPPHFTDINIIMRKDKKGRGIAGESESHHCTTQYTHFRFLLSQPTTRTYIHTSTHSQERGRLLWLCLAWIAASSSQKREHSTLEMSSTRAVTDSPFARSPARGPGRAQYSGCGRARAAWQKPHGLRAPVDKIFGPWSQKNTKTLQKFSFFCYTENNLG
jgi:hypothetical protein